MTAPLILVLAGGTGGHVYPALAVARELASRGHRVEWVGTSRGLESRVVPAAGFMLHHLPVRGLRGKSPLDTLRGILALLLSAGMALWLVLRRSPGCVIGMGGYAAGPAGLAARLLRRPLVLHEQNAVAGTTNRLLACIASARLAGFPDAFPARHAGEFVGNPVRAELLQAARAQQWFFDGSRPLRLLVLGGSLGARPINELVAPLLLALQSSGCDPLPLVWHQCGDAHAESVGRAYAEAGLTGVRCDPFIEDMAGAYAWADLVLCRAGALTIAELAVMSRPSLLVPLPHAIDDHQRLNALYLADRGAALLLPQASLTAEGLAAQMLTLIRDPDRLAA
ncbi:MAG: undecaprenyldiphospho-muramoylpentapeptide beta-N-acetylglucosaminyltransferase, partial [Chromatocurvus sp.]